MNMLTNAILGLTTTLGASGAAVLVNTGSVLVAPAYARSLIGTISAVDLEARTFSLMTDDGSSHALSVNDETTYLLDGEASTAEKVLILGAVVEATVDEQGLASIVSRTAS